MSVAHRRCMLAWLLLLLTVAGCAAPKPPAPALSWDGQAITGATFHELARGQVVIHAEASIDDDLAAQLLKRAEAEAVQLRDQGRIDFAATLHLWLIPKGSPWPANVPAPPPGRSARAAAPGTAVIRLTEPVDWGGAGLPQAMAIAATQQPSSPAYLIDWIHEGMGVLLEQGDYRTATANFGDETPGVRLGQLANATDPTPWQEAALALAEAVVDRHGIAWIDTYPRTAEQLTPSAALRWAMHAEDDETAVRRWEERTQYIDEIVKSRPNAFWFNTAADMSPARLQPKLDTFPTGPGPNENYSPHSYEIDVRYEPQHRTVAGTLRLKWQNGEGIPVDQLYFHLWPNAEQYAAFGGAMTIQGVEVDGQASQYLAQGLDLTVPLGRPIANGQQTNVRIHFTSRLPAKLTRPFGQETPDRFFLAHWFPTLAVLDDRGWILHAFTFGTSEPYAETAQFKVRLNVPKGFLVGATGVQTARLAEGDRWIYEFDAPNVRDWVANGGTELIMLVRDVDGVRIRVLERNEQLAKQTLDEVEKAMRIANERFGKYPWAELGVSCCVGMEYAGYIYTDDAQKVPLNRYLYVVYHEFTHEWFYGVVGNDQYNEPWMDEGFNTYADRVVHRALGLKVDDLESHRKYPIHVSASQYDYTAWLSMSHAYLGGALVLEDLEAELGAAVMDRLIKEWVRRYQFKVATTPEFVQFVEEFTGRDFDQWFRERGVYPEDRQPYRPVLPPGQMRPHLVPPPPTKR